MEQTLDDDVCRVAKDPWTESREDDTSQRQDDDTDQADALWPETGSEPAERPPEVVRAFQRHAEAHASHWPAARRGPNGGRFRGVFLRIPGGPRFGFEAHAASSDA